MRVKRETTAMLGSVMSWILAVAVLQFDVIAVSPADGTVVISTESEGMQVVQSGETIPSTTYRVSQILPDRIVVRPEPSGSSSTQQMYWVYVREPGQHSQITELDVQPPTDATPGPVIKTEIVR